MKEMNSLTHSCMHSFASFAILALSGRAIFMIRATGAKLRMLASDAVAAALFVPLGVVCGGEVDERGDEDDMSRAAGRRLAQVHGDCEWLAANTRARDWQLCRHPGPPVGSNPSTCREARRRANQRAEEWGQGEGIRTIGDWKPSVLLLDFEFVPEALGLCVCAFSIHVCLFSVRRLSGGRCDIVFKVLGQKGPLHLLRC